ncbi:MAG: tetratricopeptide repeat protein [Bacteroidales bacterium]
MEYALLNEKYKHACQLVTSQRLREAFIILQDLAETSRQGDFLNQLENHRETYRNILRYSFGEVEDPEKKTVYFRLLKSVIELADAIYSNILFRKKLQPHTLLQSESGRLLSLSPEEINKIISLLGTSISSPERPDQGSYTDSAILLEEQEKTSIRLFHHYWLTDKYQDQEKELGKQLLDRDAAAWWNQSLLVSAITLSLQRQFDESKFELLVHAYRNQVQQVWQRALVGLTICLYQHHARLFLYPHLQSLVNEMHEFPDTEKYTEAILIQFIKARDTEKIARKFREEIFPEMAKIHTRIYDKLDMNNLVQDPLSEDKNPDWEHVFHDSPGLVNKLEEFSMLQMEGSDVFLSTFAMLKQFDFFGQMANWFLPFYKENPELIESLRQDDASFDAYAFAEGMEKSAVLCNSDKYSFCLNVKRMPSVQRKMMIEIFNMEIKAMEEISDDDELLRKPGFERIIFSQYIQDLYRFHKLFPQKNDFFDIFATPLDIYNTGLFRWLIRDLGTARNIGEFLFEKNYYEEAIELFSRLENLGNNSELWQKIAYSYQQLGNWTQALEYYLKADLTDIRKAWNVKKIALCYRKLGNHPKALEYYQEASRMEPDNLQIEASLAHTYFDLRDYENALKVYFKVEYLAPDNHKIQRPIAWCAFMLKKPDTARKYFEKVLQAEGNQHDLLNLGHVEWCLGNKQKAIEWYRQCLRKSAYNFDWFAEELSADSEILQDYGIDPVDIPLMQDYLKILAEQER